MTGPEPYWKLLLYVRQGGPHSLAAQAQLSHLCQEGLPEGCQLEVVDVLEDPERAEADGVWVTPTLVRRAPGPMRKVIGGLIDRERVLATLGARPPTE